MQRLTLTASVCCQSFAQVLLAALLVFFSDFAFAQQTGRNSSAALSGTVKLNDGKDSPPARNITVALLKNDLTANPRTPVAKTTTDADGHYKFTNIPAGKYRIAPLAPAFTLDEGGRNFWDIGKELNVAAGENVEDVDFTLTRGGVITGRITDSDGKPVIAQRITVYKFDEKDAKNSRPVSQWQFQTDDRGIYRVYGLAPGKYLVSVGEAKEIGSVTIGRGGRYYPQAFYPSATEIAQAKPVEVSSGSEATDIDIQVAPPTKTYSVSGRVVDENGQPVADATIARGSMSADGRFTGGFGFGDERSDENGEFRVTGFIPGHHGIWAMIGDNPFSSGAQSNLYSDPAIFDITDADVNGLEIKVHTGATISGAVVMEGAQTPDALAKLKNITLGVSSDLRASPPSRITTKPNADGSFQFTGVRPGKVRINVYNSQSNVLHLVRIERDGVVQSGGIDVAPQENVTGVRVVVALGANTLRGQINYTNGTPPSDARVMITARRADSPANSYSAYADADARGKFTLENLTAGTYQINASVSSPTRGLLGSAKLTVSVNDGENPLLVVDIDLSKTPTKGEPHQ
jgi:protocatechuate 3,4-dioxygenase beta subunit